MLDEESRRKIADALGRTVDDLVRELYSNKADGIRTAQEPEISSRICQKVEDELDGRIVGEYVFNVIAQSMPDRGPQSIERITGADIFLSVSLEGPDGFDKGVFIQAKYDDNAIQKELEDDCDRMEKHIGPDGSYVWIYRENGVKVLSPFQIRNARTRTVEELPGRSVAGLTGRILDCNAGSQAWGIPTVPNRRQLVQERLRDIKVKHALDVALRKKRKQR